MNLGVVIGNQVWIAVTVAAVGWVAFTVTGGRAGRIGPAALGRWLVSSWLGRGLALAGWMVAGWHLFCQRP